MKHLLFCLSLIGIFTISTASQANAEECAAGKVEKCFVDGANTNCVCVEQPSQVDANPTPEPDGQVNQDGGGQEGM